VAEAMVELAIHSRRSEHIGAAHALTVRYWMAPDWTGKLMAGLGVIVLARSLPFPPDRLRRVGWPIRQGNIQTLPGLMNACAVACPVGRRGGNARAGSADGRANSSR